MRLLLDTHALIWWFLGDERLPLNVRRAIDGADEAVLVSAVSAFEIALKHWLSKLPQAANLVSDLVQIASGQGFEPLPISLEHARAAGSLPIAHKDPFDRLLIAQALTDDLTLISNEAMFDRFSVRRLW